MSIDRISNMLVALKNASMSGKGVVEVFHTKQCQQIAGILEKRGFLKEIKVFKPAKSTYKMLHLELVEKDGSLLLTQAKRISKPGRRIYKGFKDIKSKYGSFGVLIVSTPKGIMDANEARKKKLGGEVICEVI